MSFMDLDILSKMYWKQELGTDSNYFFLQSYSYEEILYTVNHFIFVCKMFLPCLSSQMFLALNQTLVVLVHVYIYFPDILHLDCKNELLQTSLSLVK